MSSKTVSLVWRMAVLSILVAGASGCELKNSEPTWTKSKIIAAKLDHPQALAVDGKYLYFILGGTVASQNEGTNNVMRMPIEGGAPTIVFKGGAKYIPDSFFLTL